MALSSQQRRFAMGVKAIFTSEDQAAKMSKELQDIRPELERNRAETAAMLAAIEVQQASADVTRKVTEEEEAACMGKAVDAHRIKAECERDLSAAMPQLNAAIDALKILTKQDVAVVRAMLKPPSGVRLVVEAVAIMLRVKPVRGVEEGRSVNSYWEPARKELLGDPNFLKRLVTFKQEKITAAMLAELQVSETLRPSQIVVCVVTALCRDDIRVIPHDALVCVSVLLWSPSAVSG